MKNPFVSHNLGNVNAFHKKLEKKTEFGIENKGKNESIIRSFREVLIKDKNERMLHPEIFLERLISTGWRPSLSAMERWAADDKSFVGKYIKDNFVGEQKNFGLSHISKDGWEDDEAMEKNLRMMADSLSFQRTITLDAQKIVRDAWGDCRNQIAKSEKKKMLDKEDRMNEGFNLNYNIEETNKEYLEPQDVNSRAFEVGASDFGSSVNGVGNITNFMSKMRRNDDHFGNMGEEENGYASKMKVPGGATKQRKGRSDPVEEEFSASSLKRAQGGSLKNYNDSQSNPNPFMHVNPKGNKKQTQKGVKIDTYFKKPYGEEE